MSFAAPGVAAAVDAIAASASVTSTSVTSTSIVGSTPDTASSGSIGATGSGLTVSAGVGVADSKNAIASVPNCTLTAALNVGISAGST